MTGAERNGLWNMLSLDKGEEVNRRGDRSLEKKMVGCVCYNTMRYVQVVQG